MRNRSMSTLDGAFWTGTIARVNELTLDSIQAALRMYLQPIKNDDPQLDFYTMYHRETTEHDTKYMQKYNDDLNTTLIFVRSIFLRSLYSIDNILRPVCSLRSAPPSSSMSSPSSGQTLVNGPKPSSEQSSSPSTDLLLQMKTLQALQHGTVHLQRSSQPQTSCMQVF